MNDQMQKFLLARLDILSAKLGIAGQALWQTYVRQARIDGWECLLSALFFGVAAALCGWGTYKFAKSDDDDFGCAAFLVGVASVIACIVLAVNAADLLLNPNLWAFKEIIASVK